MANMWQGQLINIRAVALSDMDYMFNTNVHFDTDEQRLCDSIYVPMNPEMRKPWVEKQATTQPDDHLFTFIIEDKIKNAVGCINITRADARNGTFMYGIGIHEKYQRKGYARETITILLEYFFNELRYNKCNAGVYSFNLPSQRLQENLGFKNEGVLRQMIYTQGNFFDEICYGITKDEFIAIHKQSK